MKETITRKDGIVYERKKKDPKEYNKSLNIRISEDELNKIKLIAQEESIEYSKLIRKIITNYIIEQELEKEENNL